MPDNAWVSTAEATRLLGVMSRTIDGLINDGPLPADRMGRVIRLKTDDIDAFIERARIRPGELG